MATAAKKTAPAKKPGTALVPWEQQMANRAKRVQQTEKPFGASQSIGTRGGFLSIDGAAVEGNSLRIVILDWVHENQLYKGDFDADNPTVPVCYAYNDPDNEDVDPDETMGAHKEAEEPQGTDEPWGEGEAGNACSGCWANKMGTAEKGRGKACKNIRRLMVVTEDALESPEAMANAEMRKLNVPVMSVRHWTKFANGVAEDLNRDPSGVVCEIACQPDQKANFVITFTYQEPIDFTQELWEALEKKRAEARKALLEPYPKQADLDASKPVKPQGRMAQAMNRGKPGAKAAPAKTGSKKF